MKRRLLYYAFLVLTGWISFSQCKKGESPYTVPIEPDTAPPPPSGLIGTWIEANTSLFGGSIYQLEFFADSSFRHRLYKYTDIYTTPQDSCNHTHTQYVKGAFWAKDGYLRLTGKYCDANYKKETPSCSGYLNYVRFSTYQVIGDKLILETASHDPQKRILKKQ